MKKLLSALLIAGMAISFVGCSNNPSEEPNQEPSVEENEGEEEEEQPAGEGEGEEEETENASNDLSEFSFGMITDVGGVNDQSFNQSAWEGLQKLEEETHADISYNESQQESDYGPNIDSMIDEGKDIIWGIGFMMADAIENAAITNPEQLFAIVDNEFENTPDNVINVVFKAEEPSFLVGYMAGLTTETDIVGYIGGIKSETIDQFEYGYLAGVEYAAQELGKEIEVKVQYANSFSDSAMGKAIATTMYTNGADIIFHVAGNAGQGLIEAAKEMNKLAIGVDRDQSDLAPENVMTSALKLVGQAMYETCVRVANGEELGGQTLVFGLAEGAVGVPAYEGSTAELVDEEVYNKTMEVKDKILAGDIVAPKNEAEFDAFLAGL